MGVCFLNDDQTRKNKENDNKEISILEETKNDNQILNEQNQKNDFIKNRLSERTIFADIYKEYVIGKRLQSSVSLSSLLAIYKNNTPKSTGNIASTLLFINILEILYQRNNTKEKLMVYNINTPIFPGTIHWPMALTIKINGPLWSNKSI
jgi:hypothetical protein